MPLTGGNFPGYSASGRNCFWGASETSMGQSRLPSAVREEEDQHLGILPEIGKINLGILPERGIF